MKTESFLNHLKIGLANNHSVHRSLKSYIALISRSHCNVCNLKRTVGTMVIEASSSQACSTLVLHGMLFAACLHKERVRGVQLFLASMHVASTFEHIPQHVGVTVIGSKYHQGSP